MAKRDRTRESLDALALALVDPHAEVAKQALTKALSARSNLVVSAALDAICTHELEGYDEGIYKAFERAMHNPGRSDPGCRTKTAAVKALIQLRVPADAVFMIGVRHVQLEPIWGGKQDVAAQLRSHSGMALINRRHPEAMVELACLLGDPQREVRRNAAQAIEASGDVLSGVPLLMLRVSVGDEDPEVLSACFTALLSLDAELRFDFVAGKLQSENVEMAEAAALALGQARPSGAFEALRSTHEANIGELRKIAALALAMLREDAAWDYLLECVREGEVAEAGEAIEALAVYREHGDLRERITAQLARREGDSATLDDLAYEILGAS